MFNALLYFMTKEKLWDTTQSLLVSWLICVKSKASYFNDSFLMVDCVPSPLVILWNELHFINGVEFSWTSRWTLSKTCNEAREHMTWCIFLSLYRRPFANIQPKWNAWSRFQWFRINILRKAWIKGFIFQV